MQRDYCPLFRAINTSVKLADLPDDQARLFYLLLLPQCDSWGRITSNPRVLAAKVWPLLGKPPEATERAIELLQRAGLIECHEDKSAAVRWIQIPDWEEKAGRVGHSDRRGKSVFPAPSPESVRTHSGVTPDLVPSEESRGEERRADISPRQARCTTRTLRKSEDQASQTKAHPRRQVSDHWCARFLETRGTRYSWAKGKDGGHLSRVLEAAEDDVAEVCRRIDRFLEDDFWRDKADFQKFAGQWNAMAGAEGSGTPLESNLRAIMEAQRAVPGSTRHDLVGNRQALGSVPALQAGGTNGSHPAREDAPLPRERDRARGQGPRRIGEGLWEFADLGDGQRPQDSSSAP